MRATLQPSTDPATYPVTHRVRPRFAETDAMGVVHHGAYPVWLEEARVVLLERAGHPYEEVRAGGVDFAVLELAVRYRRAVRFGEPVDVHLVVGGATRATFQVGYLLTVDGEPATTAVTVHGAVDATGRATRLPGWVADLARGA